MMEFKNTSKKPKAVRVTGGLVVIKPGEAAKLDPSKINGDAAYLEGLKASGLEITQKAKRVKKAASKTDKTTGET